MRVFHASTIVVKEPDVLHSRDYLDFGKGFYVTRLKGQADRYAERFTRRGRPAYVSEYELNIQELEGFNVLKFDAYDDKWLDFVMSCRHGDDGSDWDAVIGGIANDRVFATVDLYFSGEMTREEALGRLMFVKPNDQICLRSQEVLDRCLEFIQAEAIS